jgi:hypothetical protein
MFIIMSLEKLDYLSTNVQQHSQANCLESYIRLQYSRPGQDASFNIRCKYELSKTLGEYGPIIEVALKSSALSLLLKHFEWSIPKIMQQGLTNLGRHDLQDKVRECLDTWSQDNKRLLDFKDYLQNKRNEIFKNWLVNFKQNPFSTMIGSISKFSYVKCMISRVIDSESTSQKSIFGISGL